MGKINKSMNKPKNDVLKQKTVNLKSKDTVKIGNNNIKRKPHKDNSKQKLEKVKTEVMKETGVKTKESEPEENKIESKQVELNQNQKERNERTLFIGNLPLNIKKRQLEKFLGQYGKMESCRFRKPNGKKILNKMKLENVSNIIAFAVMNSVEDANKCLILNGTDFKNYHIRVTKLEKNYSNDESTVKRTIFVGNLKYSATDEKLHNIFSTCGNVEYVRTINNENGCNGCAYICFAEKESVGLALELDKTLLDDRPIHVEKYSLNKKNKNTKKKPEKVITGFQKRMMKKMAKELGHKLPPLEQLVNRNKNRTTVQEKQSNKKEDKKPLKKSTYRGKKAEAKNAKFKKNKKRNPFKELANKIAPKD